MKSRGIRHVAVSSETLASLARPPAKASSVTATQGTVAPASAAAKTVEFAPPKLAAQPQSAVTATKPVLAPPSPGLPKDFDFAQDSRLQAKTMDQLRDWANECQRCPHLARARTTVVFGVGNPKAELMFVGEAPGADEDAQGEPFVGKAGQLLTRIIQTMGLSRDQVYIANILKCRPDTPGQQSGNRKPTAEEMQTCLPFLIKQIEFIEPKVMVALGATAVEGLLGKTIGITKLRGHFQEFHGIPIMPTYHPAYLLRNQSLAIKREVWEDMLLVMEKLGMPVSDKQRRFFLTPTT